jgi:hypothetical protein
MFLQVTFLEKPMPEFDANAYSGMLCEVFAKKGRYALKKALVKDPLRFVHEMQASLARARKDARSASSRELTETELDERGRLLLRALGRERMARLMNEPEREGGGD